MTSPASTSASAPATAVPSDVPELIDPEQYKKESLYRVGKLLKYFSKRTSVLAVSDAAMSPEETGVNVLRLDRLAELSVGGSTLIDLFSNLSDGIFRWKLLADQRHLLWHFRSTNNCVEATRLMNFLLWRLSEIALPPITIERDEDIREGDSRTPQLIEFGFDVPSPTVSWANRMEVFKQIVDSRTKDHDMFVYDIRTGGRLVINWKCRYPPASVPAIAVLPTTAQKRTADALVDMLSLPDQPKSQRVEVLTPVQALEAPVPIPMLRTPRRQVAANFMPFPPPNANPNNAGMQQ